MVMPFGKHCGIPLENLPAHYLDWLSQLETLREPLASGVREECRRRNKSVPDFVIPAGDRSLARQIIDVGYKALAKQLHPDIGGSTVEMQRLNVLAARLREQLT